MNYMDASALALSDMGNAASGITSWIWLAASVRILGAGLIIAKRYKHSRARTLQLLSLCGKTEGGSAVKNFEWYRFKTECF